MAPAATQAASKASKKRASKIVERTDSPAPSTNSAAQEKAGEAQDEGSENPYVKELHKQIRNANKKIAHASKTDAQVSQHPGKTLDELVTMKVINADQKAQILKKPALQEQVSQLEEQVSQYQKVHEHYQARAAGDKASWETGLEKVKADAAAEAEVGAKKAMQDSLLCISQFLRLAAYRREEAQDPESDESQAIEGVLLTFYSGDANAVSSMQKLVEGAEEPVTSVPGEQLQTTYAKVKTLSSEYKSPFEGGAETAEVESTKLVETDPTVANASATEIEAGDDAALTNGTSVEHVTNGITNASVGDDAANAVAESHWDTTNDMSISQEWVDVKVPRDPAETETGLEATPAAPANTQSWADDQPDPIPEPKPAADPNDGFHQVQRNRPRHEREGSNWRGGRGGRGDFRGRGRGNGRGQGRGRGGAPRAPRRSEES